MCNMRCEVGYHQVGDKGGEMSQILRFHGRFRFLSNFWPASVVMDGEVYPTVEHAYQAAKIAELPDGRVVVA